MLSEQQRAILQELKKRQLSPEQQTIVAELEKRDQVRPPQGPDSVALDQTLRLGTQAMNPNLPGSIPPELAKQLGNIPRMDPNQVADAIGEKAAEGIGGIPGAAIGTGIQMIPRVADTTYTVAAMGGPKAIAKGVKAPFKAIRDIAMSTKDKRLASQAIGKAHEAAGIIKRVPGTKQIARDLQLPKGQQQWSDVVNNVRESLVNGKDIGKQVANDFLAKADELFKAGQVPKGTPTEAVLTETTKLARKYLNANVPGREAASKAMAKAAQKAKMIEFMKMASKEIAKKGLISAGLGGAAALGFKVFK